MRTDLSRDGFVVLGIVAFVCAMLVFQLIVYATTPVPPLVCDVLAHGGYAVPMSRTAIDVYRSDRVRIAVNVDARRAQEVCK